MATNYTDLKESRKRWLGHIYQNNSQIQVYNAIKSSNK